MKKNRFKILTVACVVGANLMFSSCVDNLLNQTPGGELASSLYWKTESDAEYAVNGVYSQARAMFNRDYVFDGNTEYLRFRGNVGTSQATGDRSIAYRNGSYNNPSSTYGSSFDNYYQYAYATVNRANYAIQNIEKMLPDAKTEESKAKLEAFIGEAKMLRGMAYFRLISMWGDVPYFDKIIESNDEVANISRTSITEIKQHIYDDFTYAWEKLPAKPVALGRFTNGGLWHSVVNYNYSGLAGTVPLGRGIPPSLLMEVGRNWTHLRLMRLNRHKLIKMPPPILRK